jgi:hypothetical protein
MTRKSIANLVGCLGIACSLAFWIWDAILLHLSFHQREVWMRLDLGTSNLWPALWLAGFLLALVATAIGSRRWILAAVLPVLSCAAAVILLSRIHS